MEEKTVVYSDPQSKTTTVIISPPAGLSMKERGIYWAKVIAGLLATGTLAGTGALALHTYAYM